MKRAFRILSIALLAGAALAGWRFRGEISALFGRGLAAIEIGNRRNRPDPRANEIAKAEAERWRKDLAKRYRAAGDEASRREVVKEASVFLDSILPDLMTCWLGTPWDFNGTAEGPGEAPIACGYFVATVLRDAGFQVDRYQLARQPSQSILRTFVRRPAMTLRVGMKYEDFAKEIRSLPAGVWIVGLDTHVGFLVTRPDGFHFVHSSGSEPWCVVDETETRANVLRKSNYRVYGCLTSDPEVARRWIVGEKFDLPRS
ncbi:hypothetical protein [Haloferula sargassicola]|uniref:Uncharacterized protein n=1 Tax=Haloferula sargassicola TaxID=490096 RepID=A0ABP9UXT6_9BACT